MTQRRKMRYTGSTRSSRTCRIRSRRETCRGLNWGSVRVRMLAYLRDAQARLQAGEASDLLNEAPEIRLLGYQQ
jgi:hypothetical protein